METGMRQKVPTGKENSCVTVGSSFEPPAPGAMTIGVVDRSKTPEAIFWPPDVTAMRVWLPDNTSPPGHFATIFIVMTSAPESLRIACGSNVGGRPHLVTSFVPLLLSSMPDPS